MSDERIEFLKSLIETNPDKYNVMVDLRTGNIRLLKSTKSKYYVHIGQIDLRNPKSTKLYIQKKGSELYQLIRKYEKTPPIKSLIVYKIGVALVISSAVQIYVN